MKPISNEVVISINSYSLYDESGVVCYEYGDMGEVTKETRIYALPFLNSPLALTTQFRYDSWGRVDSIIYPDGERLKYQYDLGGQLQRITNNSSYTYLDNVSYDRFGAKVSQTYGNGITTDYSYNNVTRRLSTITTPNGNSQISTFAYTYDPVGNVTQVASSYSWLNNQSFTESFTYDASDQLVAAVEHGGDYSLAVTYGDWGKVNTYDLTQSDRLQNISTQNAYTFTYPTDPNSPQQAQTHFAPTAQLGGTGGVQAVTAQYTFGINGSLRKKEHLTHNNPVEYYLFNSAANMKAYSYDKTDFAYYGYNASNTRTYKLNFLNANSWVNGQQLPIHPQSIQAMFYPNAYLNFNQNGEYTKHYYNGTERIASRLGNTALSISMEMTDRLQERVGKLETRFQDDIRELVYTNVQVETPPVSVSSLQQTGSPDDIFYYHMNHLGSTAFVTDNNATITQGFLYAPFGEITTEYNANFGSDIIPKYSFNAKELDEETGMYYYEARYYKPPVFTSRDVMMDQKPWLTPYHYCSNNPVGRVDPSGMFDKERQAVRSREKAIKQYGNNRVSAIMQSESGQYYYNILRHTIATSSEYCGMAEDGVRVLKTVNITADNYRSIYDKDDFKKCVKRDMKSGYLPASTSFKIIESMYDFDEKFQEAAYSFLSGAILYNPLVGVPNDIKTLVTGEDIYGNSATTGDRIWAAAGIVTLGTSKWLKKAGKAIHKQINKLDKMIDTRSAIKTSINNNDDD